VEERKRSKNWHIAMKAVEWIRCQLCSLGPYLAVELFLPGGSIVALLLWTYRHRTAARPPARRSLRQNGQLRRCGIGRSLRSLSTINWGSHRGRTLAVAEVVEDAAAVHLVPDPSSARPVRTSWPCCEQSGTKRWHHDRCVHQTDASPRFECP
jgi:hypothetical protein